MTLPRDVWELPHRHIGRRVWRFDEVGSTNDIAASADESGLAVIADRQTSGRGQYGRTWFAPRGSSVLLSVRLDPPPSLRRPALLTAWAAVSVCETIRVLTDRQARIKWPNDVLLHGRKVCGVLIEQSRAVIAGVGLNVNQSRAEFDSEDLHLAGSLAMAAGRTFDPDEVARALLATMEHEYNRLHQGDEQSLETNWNNRLGLLGHDVAIVCFDETRIYGRLLECSFSGVVVERGSGVIASIPPEQIRAIARDILALQG